MTLQSVACLWLGQQAVMAVAAVAVVAVVVVLAVAVVVVVVFVVVMEMGMNGAWRATASPLVRPRGPRPPRR